MKHLWTILLLCLLTLNQPLVVAAAAAEGEQDYTPPEYEASPSAQESSLRCINLSVASGNNQTAPASVSFVTQIAGGEARSYRYHFGDGVVEQGLQTITHRYETGGSYQAFVEVRDKDGAWATSPACQTTVELSTAITAKDRVACTQVQVISGQDAVAPSRVHLRVAGMDTQGAIQHYRLDYGDGKHQENSLSDFYHTYEKPGTYVAMGAIQDSQGNWHEDKQACKTTIRVLTQPLTQQPETGSPIELLLSSLVAGVVGVSLLTARSWNRKREVSKRK